MKEPTTENDVYQLLSKNLKRLRSIQNISQLGLACNAGLTHNFINDIENCKKGISARTLAKLSTALNIEPYQLFLPDNMADSQMKAYIGDFNDSLNTLVRELNSIYIRSNSDISDINKEK